MARREEGEYSTYSTDEQRRQRAKDQARWEQYGAVEALGPPSSFAWTRAVLGGGWSLT
jgi:hypothetical protein